MGLDLRLPIGSLLAIIGVILLGQGIFGDAAIYQRSLGININLIWGGVLAVTGAGLVFAARRRT
ncbi:MAG: hypothetical protein HYZ37_16370 [Candidatus Solibacter usitatus]|nr:hypothetical protein [Candidatus Solibacter usitatus]